MFYDSSHLRGDLEFVVDFRLRMFTEYLESFRYSRLDSVIRISDR